MFPYKSFLIIIDKVKGKNHGTKNMREKLLEDYNDVFSDIFNGLLFEDKVIEQQLLMEMEKEGRSVTMCKIAQALEEKGIEKGIEQGIKQERINTIQKMIRKGYSEENILELLDCTKEEFEEAENQLLTLAGN